MKASYCATAEAYARDVVAGRILAGKYIRLACQRHLDDLAWQDDAPYAFRFDPKKGARVAATGSAGVTAAARRRCFWMRRPSCSARPMAGAD